MSIGVGKNSSMEKAGGITPINFICCSKLEKDLFLIEKKYEVRASGHGMDITGPFWMLIRIATLKGKTAWKSGTQLVVPEKKVVWLYVPPYEWTSEFDESGTLVEVEGLFSITSPERHWPKAPCLFYSTKPIPRSLKAVSAFFRQHTPWTEVALQPAPSGTAQKVKAALDQKFAEDVSMADISRRLRTSSAVISRQFRASYGFTPESHRVQKSQKTPGRASRTRVKASIAKRSV